MSRFRDLTATEYKYEFRKRYDGYSPNSTPNLQSLPYKKCTQCDDTVYTPEASLHIERCQRKEDPMSRVAWCDPGDHAFKADTPGSQSGSMSVNGPDGTRKEIQYDACPKHAFGVGQESGQPTLPWTEQ